MSPIPAGTIRQVGMGLCMALALLGLGACATPEQRADAEAPTDAEVRAAIADSLATRQTPHAGSLAERLESRDRLLIPLYEARGYDPIWVDRNGANEKGLALFRRLASAKADALSPERYGLDTITAPLGDSDADSLAEAELYFSRALMQYAADLRGIGNYDPAVVALAGTARDIGGYLDTLVPANPDYRRLRAAMKLYLAIEEDGGWTPIPQGGKLRKGASDPRVLDLRSRLGATGDLAASEALSASQEFDAAVAEAVRRFQARHGLVADGIIGKHTLAALNVPVQDRIAALARNLEAYRGSEYKFGERAVVVNVAAAELTVIEGGMEVLRSRAIVGKRGSETPLMSSTITALEINPSWTVPRSITLNELLPSITKGGEDYLRKRGFRLLDGRLREMEMSAVDWSRVGGNRLPFILRQDPGPLNALGHVKFMFPNNQDIYLHDTPSRRLFTRANRALSHGCVRVAKADELARILLKHNREWAGTAYREAIETGETVHVRLKHPIPLYMVNLTAWVEPDGTVQFREDHYAPKEPGTAPGQGNT